MTSTSGGDARIGSAQSGAWHARAGELPTSAISAISAISNIISAAFMRRRMDEANSTHELHARVTMRHAATAIASAER